MGASSRTTDGAIFFREAANARRCKAKCRADAPAARGDRGRCAEGVGRHVVTRTPHFADIRESEFARAFICEHHHARIFRAHRRRNRMPADPHTLEFLRIAARRHDVFHVVEREAFSLRAFRTPLPLPVVAFERSDDLREFGLLSGIARRGNIHGVLEKINLSRHVFRAVSSVRIDSLARRDRRWLLSPPGPLERREFPCRG